MILMKHINIGIGTTINDAIFKDYSTQNICGIPPSTMEATHIPRLLALVHDSSTSSPMISATIVNICGLDVQ